MDTQPANREVAGAVAADRVDPQTGGLEDARRAVGGIKLHRRAEHFGLGDRSARQIFAFAQDLHLSILVHAGRRIPSLGRDALELARAYPSVPIILAHAAISDLAWIWRDAAGQRNLCFDTAWWNTADQLALFALIPPGQILFASDTPYGRTVAVATIVLRVALAAGLSVEQIAGVAGGQPERLLAGTEPLELGPAPMTGAAAPGPLLERVHTLLVAADRTADGRISCRGVFAAGADGLAPPSGRSRRCGRRVGARTAGPPRRLSLDESATARSASSRPPPDLRRGRGGADARRAAPRGRDAASQRTGVIRVDGETLTA